MLARQTMVIVSRAESLGFIRWSVMADRKVISKDMASKIRSLLFELA